MGVALADLEKSIAKGLDLMKGKFFTLWEDSIEIAKFLSKGFSTKQKTLNELQKAFELHGSKREQIAFNRYFLAYGLSKENNFFKENNLNIIDYAPDKGWFLITNWENRVKIIRELIQYEMFERPKLIYVVRETYNRASFMLSFWSGYEIDTDFPKQYIFFDNNLKPLMYSTYSAHAGAINFESWLKENPMKHSKIYKAVFEQAKDKLLELKEEYQLEDLIREDINHN